MVPGFCLFNNMVMQKNTDEVLTQMKEAAAIACRSPRLEFGEVMALAKEKLGEQIESDLFGEASAHALSGTDKREAGLSLVKRAVEAAGIAPPAAVAFFAAPYCPHNTLDPEAENEAALKAALECVLKETEAKTGDTSEF
jgi:arginine utilization protein RocB